MLTIRISGIEGVEQTLARIPKASERAVMALAERIHELAREGADKHTKTGALIDSLGHGPKRIPGGWEIGHDRQRAPHAIFVHWGAKPHVIKPKKRKILRWPGAGGFIFARFVRHPGYKGDPWLAHAADQAVREFDRIVAQSMKGI